MGVGGGFDVSVGKTKRAPGWMQPIGLEWFYGFLQEPTRMWNRYLVTNTLFLFYLRKEKPKGIKSSVTMTSIDLPRFLTRWLLGDGSPRRAPPINSVNWDT